MEQTDRTSEASTVIGVLDRESAAFWNKDYAAWAECWVHAPYIRTMGWWERGGVTVISGWEALSERMQTNFQAHPDPNPTATQVRRENINLRIAHDVAWVTFDQYGSDTGEPAMDMPGVSRETRILEKHDGAWKIVYVNWLLEGPHA